MCSVKVRLGEQYISSKEDCSTLRGRKQCIVYEEYDVEKVLSSDEHDVSLLRLANDVTFKREYNLLEIVSEYSRYIKHICCYFSTAHIAPICLPLNATIQSHEETIGIFAMTGWGFVENPEKSNRLQESNVYGEIPEANEANIILGTIEENGCHGDLGSPLAYADIYLGVQRFVQFGVLSSGLRDCPVKKLTFTGISQLIPWITRQIGGTREAIVGKFHIYF